MADSSSPCPQALDYLTTCTGPRCGRPPAPTARTCVPRRCTADWVSPESLPAAAPPPAGFFRLWRITTPTAAATKPARLHRATSVPSTAISARRRNGHTIAKPSAGYNCRALRSLLGTIAYRSGSTGEPKCLDRGAPVGIAFARHSMRIAKTAGLHFIHGLVHRGRRGAPRCEHPGLHRFARTDRFGRCGRFKFRFGQRLIEFRRFLWLHHDRLGLGCYQRTRRYQFRYTHRLGLLDRWQRRLRIEGRTTGGRPTAAPRYRARPPALPRT